MKMASALSLRSLLMLVVGLLVLSTLAPAIGKFREARSLAAHAAQLDERNQAADRCLQAFKAFALERGRSRVLLLSGTPASAEQREFLAARRAEGDTQLQRLLEHLPESARAVGEQARSAWAGVRELRPRIDAGILLDPARRDPALIPRWMRAADGLAEAIENLVVAIGRFPGLDGRFERLSELRALALQFRNVTGTESSLMAVILESGRPPGRELSADLYRLRGRSAQIWNQLEGNTQALGQPDAIVALGRVHVDYFARLRRAQDDILGAMANGQRPSIVFDDYLRMAVPGLNATVDLADAINRLSGERTRELLDDARRQSVQALLVIGVVLAFATAAILLLLRRFTRPLNDIVARLDRLRDAHAGIAAQTVRPVGGDEFAQVRAAVGLLDGALEASRRSGSALRASERIKASILDRVPQAIIGVGVDGRITLFSPGAVNLLGYEAEELVGSATPACFFDADELRAWRGGAAGESAGAAPTTPFSPAWLEVADGSEREWTFVCKDGRRLTVLLATFALRDDGDALAGGLGVATDITERKAIETELVERTQELDRQVNLFKGLLETIPVGVLMVEAPSGRPLIMNDAARLLLGRDLIGEADRETLAHVYGICRRPDRQPYPAADLPIVQGLQGSTAQAEDLLIVDSDGSERVLEMSGAPVYDGDGKIWASVASLIDITSRARATAEMLRLAYHDHLTSLPNRRLFHDRIRMAIIQARREKSRVALLLVDLDRFKPVNDNYGHAVGDLLLKAAARRMQSCLRESDTLARVGGDEFMAIVPGICSDDDALGVAEKIRLSLLKPFDLEGGHTLSISCSVGVAIYPEHGRDDRRLAKHADEAMYRAKERGRNGVALFSGGEAVEAAEPPPATIILRLVWHRSFRSGHELIDREHRELFEQANGLIQAALSAGRPQADLTQIVDELIEKVRVHFADEEELLAQLAYEDLAAHAAEHRRLLERARELRDLEGSGWLTVGPLVTFIAQDLVARHMLIDDRKFFPLIERAGGKTGEAGHGDHATPA